MESFYRAASTSVNTSNASALFSCSVASVPKRRELLEAVAKGLPFTSSGLGAILKPFAKLRNKKRGRKRKKGLETTGTVK